LYKPTTAEHRRTFRAWHAAGLRVLAVAPAVHAPSDMATHTPEVKDGVVVVRDDDLPAGTLFSVWTPILAAVLSVLLSIIVMMQQ
jgi:hypothetical protein